MSDESTPAKRAALATEAAAQKVQKRSLKARAIHEAKRLLAMFLYLYILFGLFNLHEYIVLTQHQIEFTNYGIALINAWIFAKVMLVAEDLHLARGFEGRSLIYPVIFKAFVFMVVFICFLVLEHVLVGLWKGETIAESIPAIGGGGLAGIASVGIIMAFALMPYFAYREIARVIGEEELRALILKRGAKVDKAQRTAKL